MTETFVVDKEGNAYALAAGQGPAGLVQVGGMSQPPFLPSDHGYLAWNFDPDSPSQGYLVTASGDVRLARVNVRVPVICTSLVVTVMSNGSTVSGYTLTAGQNYAGLYAASGKPVAFTADQSSAWLSQGVCPMPLAGGPYQLAAGTYWAALVTNTSVPLGTDGMSQTPLFLAASYGRWQFGSAARGGVLATGQASLPSSAALSGLTAGTAFAVALS